MYQVPYKKVTTQHVILCIVSSQQFVVIYLHLHTNQPVKNKPHSFLFQFLVLSSDSNTENNLYCSKVETDWILFLFIQGGKKWKYRLDGKVRASNLMYYKDIRPVAESIKHLHRTSLFHRLGSNCYYLQSTLQNLQLVFSNCDSFKNSAIYLRSKLSRIVCIPP